MSWQLIGNENQGHYQKEQIKKNKIRNVSRGEKEQSLICSKIKKKRQHSKQINKEKETKRKRFFFFIIFQRI